MKNVPEAQSLVDLLRTLERSGDLRSLARECGLSVRELRRRLAIWRREMADTNGSEPAPTAGKSKSATKASKPAPSDWPDLPPAAEIGQAPLPDPKADVLRVFTDGASRGNPGPAAIGAVFQLGDGTGLCTVSEAIGKATNNVAEYKAVVAALEHCRRWRVRRVHLFMDSELIVRQLNGIYRVKSPDLRPLYQQAVFLTRDIKDFKVSHVPRARNAHADHLANLALDR